MNKFYIENKEDLRASMVSTARKKDISEAVIEKNYWVAFILDYLLNESKWEEYLTFKGDISLSKCFRLIERFSEDIGLTLSWRLLGYEEREPWTGKSDIRQDKFNKGVNESTKLFLRDGFLKILKQDLKGADFEFSIDRIDPQAILCKYPEAFGSNYLTQNTRLGIRGLAAWTPAIDVEILSIISEAYPNVFKEKTNIRIVSTERTFWEKTTILHHKANRPEASPMPHRYARRSYDLYKVTNSDFKNKASEDRELLKKATKFGMKFYPRKWIGHEDALNGRSKLVPREFRFSEIKKDYEAMEEMTYGEYPKFDGVIKVLKRLGKEISK